jgi:Cu+-exporting ATPase
MNNSVTSGSTLKDPVCGMEADPGSSFRTTYEGRDYFFCSRHCLAEFQKDPEKYSAAVAQNFTCPRHPGVRQGEPGTCPQCGMALVAVRDKWICPYHPQVLHDEPGECPIYGMALVPEPPGRFYTCDMHPEVKQLEPGKCPHCGMTLQPSWAPVVQLRTEWFCPMHPDFVSPTPGTCPQCGMQLEPREMPAKKAKESEGACPKCGLVIDS